MWATKNEFLICFTMSNVVHIQHVSEEDVIINCRVALSDSIIKQICGLVTDFIQYARGDIVRKPGQLLYCDYRHDAYFKITEERGRTRKNEGGRNRGETSSSFIQLSLGPQKCVRDLKIDFYILCNGTKEFH